jgi:uncharacterized protein YwqG
VFTSEDQIATALIAEGLEAQDAQRIAEQARPCVWLETNSVVDEAQIPLGATKIGGRPDLPAGQDWPMRPPYPVGEHAARYREELADPKAWSWATPEQREEFRRDYEQTIEVIGKPFPLSFIAQINLAHSWRAGPLDPDFPKAGLLSIFYDTFEQLWGFGQADHIGSVVLFHAADAATLTRWDPPGELTSVKRYVPFAPLICHAQACLTPIPRDTPQFGNLNLRREAADAYSEWWSKDANMYGSQDGADWKCHRVGGWPTPIQSDMQSDCALVAAGFQQSDALRPETETARATAGEWLLLAQIGTDEGAQMMWGDSGQLYLWIRHEDLVAHRFDAARLILQCY